MRRGFTLIELLVVIAIIGILSATVLSSLNASRVRATTTQTAAQMREMRIAIERYYSENGVYPTSVTPPSTSWMFSTSYPGAYIPSIVSVGYISGLPAAPSGCAYAYATLNNGGDYKLKLNSCANVTITAQPSLVDPGQSGGSANSNCASGGSPASPSGWAVYSPGGRCLF